MKDKAGKRDDDYVIRLSDLGVHFQQYFIQYNTLVIIKGESAAILPTTTI